MQVAIRCHPYAPVDADELEEWLAREVGEIRTAAPDATVRLMRLSQAFSTGRVAVGWLIEVERANGEAALTERQLDAVLRDMVLLGLQPTLLASSAARGVSDGGVVLSSRALGVADAEVELEDQRLKQLSAAPPSLGPLRMS